MWNTFKYTVVSLVREPAIMFWVMLFPIILSTLFSVMFSGLEETAYSLKGISVAVVENEEAGKAQGVLPDAAADSFGQMLDALAEGDDALLDPVRVSGREEALDLLRSGEVVGIITLDADGWPSLEVSPVAGDVGVSMDGIERTVLDDVVSNYVRTRIAVEDIARTRPLALADPAVMQSVMSFGDYTNEITVTHGRTVGYVRYFYALLAFAAIMAAQLGTTAVSRTLPNVSALGARRAVSGTSRGRTLAGALLASWVLAFAVLIVAFVYIRVVLGIDFGEREGVCVGGLAVASLMSTSLGSFIGALPGIPEAGKEGVLTGLTCLLSLFAGLYGTPAMNFADQVARDFPWAAAINPARQVADLFYSLYVYPDYQPFFTAAATLLAMAVVLAAAAALFMRRQSYARL